MTFTLTGTGSALPEKIVTNDQLPAGLDTSDAWITGRTGIGQRHVCVEEDLTDLCETAARAALRDAGAEPGELDLIIGHTIRGEYITPSMACLVQQRLGASCPAFDLNAACSGFLYALDVAAGYFARGRVRRVLVVAGEAMSKMLDWSDRSTCVLFGDGAGAVVLEPGDDLLALRTSARGGAEHLRIPHFQGHSPYNQKEEELQTVYMNGQEVYKFAVSAMTGDIQGVLEDTGLVMDDVTWVVPHQANLRIIKAACSKLGLPLERCVLDIEHIANISAASIPIVLDKAAREDRFKRGDNLVLTAFGGGLTTGACLLRWGK